MISAIAMPQRCPYCGIQHAPRPTSYDYPHKLDALGQIAIDWGLDYVARHNRIVECWQQHSASPQTEGP